MPKINRLSTLDKITSGDLLVLFSGANSDDRKATVGALADFLEIELDLSGKKNSFTTQYSSPNAEAFNTTINDGDTVDSDNAWLILTPTGAFAAMTITLPPLAGLVDKQEVLVNSTQAVTTLTVAANGATAVLGEPASLSANDFFRLKFDKPFKTWYRVG